ncbi:MAG: hypothetical protein E6G79_20365 [Alphaproteobacteria bacterium]|nr:MAG: hypothetical protein E6G79_20365 [Alphaproteobacteria bacterium]
MFSLSAHHFATFFVIASEAKQSTSQPGKQAWIASSLALLAKTREVPITPPPARSCAPPPRQNLP